ncbi:MAG: hypothetical protein QJR08_03755 [Bacillota bacterium]|nr:hypothetical protein [Bacillota bacterium]
MAEEPLVEPQSGVESAPAAGEGQADAADTEKQATNQQADQTPAADWTPEAFAKRLAAEREKWERQNARYIRAAKALEAAGYDPESVLAEMGRRSVEELVERGMDEATAREVVRAREEAERAKREAAEARLAAEGARLARKYDGSDGLPPYDHEAVLAYAQQRADETGEAISLETAYLLMTREAVRKAGEQAVLRQLRAGSQKAADTGTRGGGRTSIESMDPTSPEFQRLVEKVLRGEKVEI